MSFLFGKEVIFIPKDTRVEEAFEKIEQGVKDVYSSDNFVNYLKMLSKFHNYSFNNVILILSQYPGASLVAGYSSWKNNFQRQVNKGEKGIRILAPYDVKVKRMEESIDDKGNTVQEEKEYKVKRFRIVSVFDINDKFFIMLSTSIKCLNYATHGGTNFTLFFR